MRKTLAVLAALFLALFASVPAAHAASPHFKKNGTPVCQVSSTGGAATADCTGTLAGLGNDDLVIQTTLSGFAVYQCQNQGGNVAPGQNKVLEGPTTTPTTIPGGDIKNGTVTYRAGGSLTAAPTVTGGEAGCPNPNWTRVNPILTVTSITQTISQGGLLFTCTASDPDGLTGSVPLSCTPA